MYYEDYISGYLERDSHGDYLGHLTIEGIDISPITGVYFKQDNVTYLWLRRCKVVEYDLDTATYSRREASPFFEAYLKKTSDDGVVTFKGEFTFLRFKFSIVGVWDAVLGTDKHNRLNLFVERLPINQQTIINKINERLRNGE